MATIDVVVREGLCVGCGACAAATDGRIKMVRNNWSYMQADLMGVSLDDIQKGSVVCPFSSHSRNETDLANQRFSDVGNFDERIGYYRALFAGRLNDDAALLKSSSGGMTSWLLVALMQNGLIDGVIHLGTVSKSDSEGELFQFKVSRTVDEVLDKRKSQYYSASFEKALLDIRGDGRRYAIVGVPCYIRGARALADRDEIYRDQLRYFIALVCGHMKSGQFAELLAWQVGVPPGELGGVDFRVKNPSADAGGYHASAVSLDGLKRGQRMTREMFGGNWGHAVFQLKSCDYCDDIFGETADACFGDAWIDRYSSDWRGTNIAVVRDATIQRLLEAGGEGSLHLEVASVDDAVRSQDGNFRHRRDGLSVRLEGLQKKSAWMPEKRVAPGSRRVSFLRRQLVKVRQDMAQKSHEAFVQSKEKKDLHAFLSAMRWHVKLMGLIYKLMRIEAKIMRQLGRSSG